MRIKNFEVSGLIKYEKSTIRHTFNEDLNIVTGRNGAGKTTLLKLLWYLISGNIEHAVREVPFTRAVLETTEYTLVVGKKNGIVEELILTDANGGVNFAENEDAESDPDSDFVLEADEAVAGYGRSVFFPTFRRIEGGFSLATRRASNPNRPLLARPKNGLEEALAELSRKMTVEEHTFVSSISTADIVVLLMKRYTEMSELSNNVQQKTSQQIIDRIRKYQLKFTDSDREPADAVIDSIRNMIEKLDSERDEILSPFTAVRSVVENLFRNTKIELNSRISFGDAANAVNSDLLSAGEKQMLSFICYNAFFNDSIIFIDEPELSLHVDWQRQLFPILLSQGTSNQFVIATHSPFIYSKYSDRELIMDNDRGDLLADI